MTCESDILRELLGIETQAAEQNIRSRGYEVVRTEYASKRGVPDADSERVIRARMIGNNSIEITVSRFKTRL